MVSDVLFSSKTDTWETPAEVYDPLNAEFGFILDAAASHENAKSVFYYTPDGLYERVFGGNVLVRNEEGGGLCGPWGFTGMDGWTWCNPPYGRGATGKFVNKAFVEAREFGNPSVLLLPARTDTRWFQQWIYKRPNVETRFLPGRIQFELGGQPVRDAKGQPMRAPFPSLLAIFHPR